MQRLDGCTNSRLHVSCKLELVTVSGVGCTVRVRSCAQNVGAVVAEKVKCHELGAMALFFVDFKSGYFNFWANMAHLGFILGSSWAHFGFILGTCWPKLGILGTS